jgi:ribosomal protein S18 acetylase RimI-like enzyme
VNLAWARTRLESGVDLRVWGSSPLLSATGSATRWATGLVLKTGECNNLGGSTPSTSAMTTNIAVNVSQEAVSVMQLHGELKTSVVQASNMGPYWYLNRAKVHNQYQGQGIGSALLKLVIDSIQELGGSVLVVEPGGYDSDPVRQRNFYLKNGFKESQRYVGALELVLGEETTF